MKVYSEDFRKAAVRAYLDALGSYAKVAEIFPIHEKDPSAMGQNGEKRRRAKASWEGPSSPCPVSGQLRPYSRAYPKESFHYAGRITQGDRSQCPALRLLAGSARTWFHI